MPQKKENRDYKKEYREYHSKPEQIKRRSKRNKARRKMEKSGRVRKGDGKEVDHKTPLSKGGSNDTSNLQVMSRSANRKKYDGGSRKNKGRTKKHRSNVLRQKSKKFGKDKDLKRRVTERQTARFQPKKRPKRKVEGPSSNTRDLDI